MSDSFKETKYSIDLQNGYIAILSESYPNEVSFYLYKDDVRRYVFESSKSISSLESSILLTLVSKPGHIISNDVLQNSVPGNKTITNNNLRQTLLSLRSLLMDCNKPHRLIKNKPRIGYGLYHVETFYGTVDEYLHTINKEDAIYNAVPSLHLDVRNEEGSIELHPTTKIINSNSLFLYNLKIIIKIVTVFVFLLFCVFILSILNQSISYDNLTKLHLENRSESITNKRVKLIHYHLDHLDQMDQEYMEVIKSIFMTKLASKKSIDLITVVISNDRSNILLTCLNENNNFIFKHFRLTHAEFRSHASIENIAHQCVWTLSNASSKYPPAEPEALG